MMPSSHHKQVRCKVATYVDELVKELVELINEFDELSTFESCQGNPDKGRLAFVNIEYGDWNTSYDDTKKFLEMACFVNKLVISFARHTREDEIDGAGNRTSISIQWRGGKRFPFICIEMPSRCIAEVTHLFSLFQAEYKRSISGKRL